MMSRPEPRIEASGVTAAIRTRPRAGDFRAPAMQHSTTGTPVGIRPDLLGPEDVPY